ncbi:hypothetical protein EDB80DRAFT_176330 [Ilyonectria destructans]|nr:hypothetical protein EDB80DRAFT_176330 [Ilyonectria destructans]
MTRDISSLQPEAMDVELPCRDTLPFPPAPSCFRPRSQRQPRITDFFASTSPPKPAPRVSFLDLPKHVREKIYDESNVGGEKFINLNFWTASNSGRWRNHDDAQLNTSFSNLCYHASNPDSVSTEDPFPAALLWAGSRLIHDEVEAKLYAQNTFAVNLMGRDGLRPLEMLSDAAVSHLRTLIVSLRCCSCLTPSCDMMNWLHGEQGDECDLCLRPGGVHFWETLEFVDGDSQHGSALGMLHRTRKQALSRWKRICARLASNVSPGQLKFYLVAEVADLETASAILDPLGDMPVLKEASICLGDELQGTQLSSLARSTALRLMNALQYPPFHFMDLPPELRLRILDYTDLTEYRFINWSEELKFHLDSSSLDYSRIAREDNIDHQVFCTSNQMAAFSPHCQCQRRVLNYFLVSKAFSWAARSVFYARNEFRLLPFTRFRKPALTVESIPGNDCSVYNLPPPLPSFMRCMPLDLISSCTHLTIVFPLGLPYALTWWPEISGGWVEWLQARRRPRAPRTTAPTEARSPPCRT